MVARAPFATWITVRLLTLCDSRYVFIRAACLPCSFRQRGQLVLECLFVVARKPGVVLRCRRGRVWLQCGMHT